MFRAPAHEVPPRRQRPQPAGRDAHPGRLAQVDAQPVRGPHVERQAGRRRRRLDRRLQRPQVGRIGLGRPPRARRVRQGRHAARVEAAQPPPHRPPRAPAPRGNLLHVLPERPPLDHLQALAHPRRQIPASQRCLHHSPHLRRSGFGGPRHPTHGIPPSLIAQPASPQLTSTYLVHRSSKAVGEEAPVATWRGRRASPDPGFGPVVEAGGGAGDGVRDLGVVGEGLAREGLLAEQAPPTFLEV